MRLATLGMSLGFSLASFALGLCVGRLPLAVGSNAGERELVAGEAAGREAPPPPAAREPAPVVAASKVAPKSVDAEPSWPRVATRAQSWTAAIRADLNYGAGLLLDRSGLVLTNLHVVSGARSITVTPFDSAASPAQVLDSDAELDLALLQVNLPNALPAAASLGSAATLSVGDEVLAVGSPRKMYFSVSRGMVSFPHRLLDGVEYIQTDLPINEGNSGGPLVDRMGRVVGIVSFILKESQGLSFALPIDRALERFAAHLSGQAAAEKEPQQAVPTPLRASAGTPRVLPPAGTPRALRPAGTPRAPRAGAQSPLGVPLTD
jgi:S1-C subfamily serine protease